MDSAYSLADTPANGRANIAVGFQLPTATERLRCGCIIAVPRVYHVRYSHVYLLANGRLFHPASRRFVWRVLGDYNSF